MSYLIRTFEENDRAAVIELWKACGLTRPWNDPNLDIDRKVAVGDDLFLVATVEDRLVGSVMAGYDGHRGWVNYLGADQSLQGTGLGRLLMDEAETRLKALGCPKINLQIRTENTGVQSFYRRLGYEPDDVVSMGKRLIADGPSALG